MIRILAVALALAALSSPAAGPNAGAGSFAEIDRDFRILLEGERIPGAAWAIVREGRIVHAAGHGVRSLDDQRTVTPDTVFRVASVSKTFAAQITGQLVAEGALHWGDPIQRYVPQFTLARPDHARRLTLEHLLGQSAGIVPNAYDNLLNAGRTMAQILPKFGDVEPMCPPGECYTYQNVLFSLVEPAIKTASGLEYGDLLRERLFEPLDMQQASVGFEGYRDSNNRAAPHVKVARKRWVPVAVDANYYRVAPAAGVNASALDLGRWLIAHLGYRPEVIRPDVVRELTRKRIRTTRETRRKGWRDVLTDAHYGLGWRIYTVEGHELVTHSGWVRGFVAQVGYSAEHDIGLVLLLNAESGVINDLSIRFWRDTLDDSAMMARRTESAPHDAREDTEAETIPAKRADRVTGD
jgi:beta-lactamase class C